MATNYNLNNFKDLKPIGRGSYGLVSKATYKPTGKILALKQIDMVKKIINYFQYD